MGSGASQDKRAVGLKPVTSVCNPPSGKSSLQFKTCDCNRCYRKGDPIPCRDLGVFTLFSMRFCPYSHRVRLVLEHKKIPYQLVHVALKDAAPEWIKELNPRGSVPILQRNEKVLYDSLVVMQYLDDIKRSNRLTPSDSFEKARQASLIRDFSKVEQAYHDVVDNLDDSTKWRLFTNELQKYDEALGETPGPFMGGYLPSLLDFVVYPFIEPLRALEHINNSFTLRPNVKFCRLNIWLEAMGKLTAVQNCKIDLSSHLFVLKSLSTTSPAYGCGLAGEEGPPSNFHEHMYSNSYSSSSRTQGSFSSMRSKSPAFSAGSKSAIGPASTEEMPAAEASAVSNAGGKIPATASKSSAVREKISDAAVQCFFRNWFTFAPSANRKSVSAANSRSSNAAGVSISQAASTAADKFRAATGKSPTSKAGANKFSTDSISFGKSSKVSPAASKSVTAAAAANEASYISAAASKSVGPYVVSSNKTLTGSDGHRKSVSFITGEDQYGKFPSKACIIALAEMGVPRSSISKQIQTQKEPENKYNLEAELTEDLQQSGKGLDFSDAEGDNVGKGDTSDRGDNHDDETKDDDATVKQTMSRKGWAKGEEEKKFDEKTEKSVIIRNDLGTGEFKGDVKSLANFKRDDRKKKEGGHAVFTI